MKGKGFLKLLLLAAVVAVVASLLGAGSAPVVGVEAASDAAMKGRILRSTVQIEMVSDARVEGDLQHRLGSQGLGTVVEAGERRFILTHDHWSLADETLSHVILRDAHGVQLLALDGASFLSLVRYRDGGAMLLAAPRELSGVAPAALYDGSQPLAGDTVWLPARAEAGHGLRISGAQVQSVHADIVPGSLWLQSAPGTVAAGDSGAGVWYNGKLIANLWGVTEVRNAAKGGPWSWSRWFGGAGDWRRTGLLLAGMQPLYGASGMAADDLVGASGDAGYERGPQR